MNEDVLNFLTDSANSIREQLGESEKYYLKDFANLIKKIPKGIIVINGNEPIKNRIKDRVYFVRYKDTEGYSYKFEDYLGNELSLSCVKNILTKYKDNTLYIAASNSNIYEKRYADYVCTGTNDEKIIQKAIDELYALGGGTVKLSSGIFNIGSFTLSSDGIYRAITLPSGDKRYTIDIVGQSQMTGEKDSSSIYGTRLFVSQDALNSIDTSKQYEVISALPSTNSPNNVIHLTEFEVRLATNQKPVVCIDLFNFGRARLDRIKCIAYTNTNASLTKAVKGCIGIRMLNGSNNGQENNFNSCGCSGFYEAFQIGGEHVVMNNCSAIKNVYGYTFGNYTYQRAFNHAITLINCCDERDVNLPYFHSNTGTQRINLIDFCIERYASATPGGVLGNLAKESKNGMFSGDISFTVMDDSATNVVNIPFFEKGNGKNFKVRNSIHALSGTTKLRESYAANQGQTYYDTDLKCLMYYLNDEWVKIAGNSSSEENDEILDIKSLNCIKGGLRTTDGSEIDSNYYVRSEYISYDDDCYYTITCPIGKCVYCFLYDENKKYVSYSKKPEGTYVYRVPRGSYIRPLFKYTDSTYSSGTIITSPSDFLADYIITRTEKELDINTNDNIYFYVDGDDGSRVPCVLRLPSTYKSSGKATQLVMCAHGAGGTIVPSTDTNQLTTWLGYVDNGYAIFDVHGASATMSKHWGNEETIHVYYRAYRYIVENYNIDETMIISGKSMGGLTAINFASYYPNVCRCIAVLYPVTDLYNQININKEMISNGNTSSMLKAYGITSWTDENTLPEKMIGFNPLHSRVVAANKILLNIPIKIWHGNADTYVDYNKTVDFVTAIKNAGGHAECVLKDGIYHGNYDKNKTPLSETNATGVVYDNYWKTEVVEKELIPWVENFKGTKKNTNKTIRVNGSNDLQPTANNNHWKNKKWYAYGTSLTDIDNVGQYCKTVRDLSGLTLTNKGKSGGGICANTLIKDAVMNTTDGKTSADLITLEVGANDTSAILGTIYDTSDNTFCGALNQCIRYLQKNTNAQIVVISSTNSRYKSGDKTVEFTPEKTFASDNHTKYDQWKAIKEVCAINSVPYIAMGEEAGLGYARMIASDKYNIDNIHHTALAGKNLGEFVWSKLKDIPLWLSELSTTTLKITTQPTDVIGKSGDSISYTVVATGIGLTYQWQVKSDVSAEWKDTSIAGSTLSTLSFTVPNNYTNRYYRCVISDSNGNTLISNAVKLILHPLKITTQPTDTSAAIGDSVIFTVVTEGNNLSYQWQVSSSNGAKWGDTALDGNKTATLTVSPVATVHNGRLYRCVVTDTLFGDTVISNAAKFTVINTSPIKITNQPTDVDSAVGNSVSFSVIAEGDGLTYQWQLSKDGGTTWGNTSVNGNTSKFINFAVPNADYNGRMFRCVITDASGNTLASNSATLTLNGVPDVTITSQPQDISAKVGDTINISVVAKSSKSNKLTYQWQVSSTGTIWSNTTVTGYNTSALNFAIPNANYNGRQYRCLVTDGNGSWALSDAMTLTVTE